MTTSLLLYARIYKFQSKLLSLSVRVCLCVCLCVCLRVCLRACVCNPLEAGQSWAGTVRWSGCYYWVYRDLVAGESQLGTDLCLSACMCVCVSHHTKVWIEIAGIHHLNSNKTAPPCVHFWYCYQLHITVNVIVENIYIKAPLCSFHITYIHLM